MALLKMDDAKFAELLNSPEGETLDFKKAFYDFSGDNKANVDFLKDLIAFSNTIRTETAYLVFGIKAHNTGVKDYHGIMEITDDAILQQKSSNKIAPPPKFKSYLYTYQGLNYGVIELPVHPHERYLMAMANQGHTLLFNRVYLRRGSMNDEAQPQEIEAISIWLKRVRKRQAPPPVIPKNDDYRGYLRRTVTASQGDSIAQLLFDHETLEQVLEKHPRIALLGWGLSGKSTEMTQLAHLLSQRAGVYAFRITFGNHFKGAIHKRIPGVDQIPPEKLYVLLDGLDEIRGKNRKQTISAILQFAEDYPKSHIIVSCRTNFYTTDSTDSAYNTLTDFASFKLDNLGSDEIDDYLGKNLGQNKADFQLEVNRKKINELLVAPYYLVKLVRQFRNGHQIAASKGQLFESEIIDLIRKDIGKLKPEERAKYEKELLGLFTKVAFVMQAKGTNQISSQDLHSVLPAKTDYKKVIKAGNLFEGSDHKERIFKFTHNNAQEYLAAKVIAQLKFKNIKEIIGIAPGFDRVNPNWVNVLSFVIDILPENVPLLVKIFDWLAVANKDLVIALDPKKMPAKLRYELFMDIFESFKKDGRRINRLLFKYEDLARFSESEPIFDYLLTELDSDDPIAKINALGIVNFYNLKVFPKYRKLFRVRYEQILSSKEVDLHYLALAGYGGLFEISPAAFQMVFKKFKTVDDTWVRYQLFTFIWLTGHQDLVVDFLIEQARFLRTDELPRPNKRRESTRLSNEFTEVSNALQRVVTAPGLTTLFQSGVAEFSLFAYSVYFSKIYEPALKKATAYPNDEALSAAIRATFIAHHSEILHKPNFEEAFLTYFEETRQIDILLKEMIAGHRTSEYSAIRTIAILTTKTVIAYLKEEREAGHIDQIFIEELHGLMDFHNNKQVLHLQTVFGLTEIARPMQRTLPSPAEVKARNLRAIFDQREMLNEVEMIFNAFGRSELSTEDRYSHGDADFWSPDFAEVARDMINLRGEPHTVSLGEVKLEIDAYFEKEIADRVYDYLLRHPQSELTAAQRAQILTWCDSTKDKVNFNDALVWNAYEGWITERNAELLAFFIRYLNLRQYPNQLYWDMLAYFRLHDNIIDIIPFVQSVIGFEATIEGILNNMSRSVPESKLLVDYLKFLETNEVNRAVPLLRDYLLSGTVNDNYQLLNAYLNLDGDIEDLQPLLGTSKSYFLHSLIEKFIAAGSLNIKAILKRKIAVEKNEDEWFAINKFLVRLQDKTAVDAYIAWLRKKGHSPDDSSPTNPLYRLTKPKFTSQALDLFELAQQPSFYADTFTDLRSISATMLQHIALYNGNFPKVQKKVGKWISKRQKAAKKGESLPDNLIQGISYLMENNAKQYEANSVKMASQEAAIALYEKISRRTLAE
jgi:hypothetical protein